MAITQRLKKRKKKTLLGTRIYWCYVILLYYTVLYSYLHQLVEQRKIRLLLRFRKVGQWNSNMRVDGHRNEKFHEHVGNSSRLCGRKVKNSQRRWGRTFQQQGLVIWWRVNSVASDYKTPWSFFIHISYTF